MGGEVELGDIPISLADISHIEIGNEFELVDLPVSLKKTLATLTLVVRLSS